MKRECHCDKGYKTHQQTRAICSYCDYFYNGNKIEPKRLPSKAYKAHKYADLVRYGSLPRDVLDAVLRRYRAYQIYKRNLVVVFDDMSVLLLGYGYGRCEKVVSHHRQIGKILLVDPVTDKIYLDDAEIATAEMEGGNINIKDRLNVKISEQDDHHYNRGGGYNMHTYFPLTLMETKDTALLYNPYEIDHPYVIKTRAKWEMGVTTYNFASAVQHFYWIIQDKEMRDVKCSCHLNDNS